MKTKILFLSFISALILSCNGDDDNSGSQPIPEDEKFLKNIVNLENQTFQFEYNSDKKLKSLNYANSYMVNAYYENNRVSSLHLLSYGENLEIYFQYDENGRISSVLQAENVKQVVYDPDGNYYLAYDENGNETIIYLNEYDDIKKIVQYDAEYDETSEFLYLYDEDHKGAMTNSGHLNLHLLLCSSQDENVEFIDAFLALFMSNKPVKTLSVEEGLINMYYEYDDQGFI